MDPNVFGVRRQVATIIFAIGFISSGLLACRKMEADIFTSLNTPDSRILLDKFAKNPDEIDGFIFGSLRRPFRHVGGVPGINASQRDDLCEECDLPAKVKGHLTAQVDGLFARARCSMLEWNLSPMMIRMDASAAAVRVLVLESET